MGGGALRQAFVQVMIRGLFREVPSHLSTFTFTIAGLTFLINNGGALCLAGWLNDWLIFKTLAARV
jgi:hypothetical protein